ncbi:LOW QUALITY PROTEIN: BTB/POZ and MATH domain-containing protein 2 [Setaria viridis]|uniref:LOW QUALITY PROTEIN: BTB/POZ and MATH domain-containing protein 2 n=1 Tax=Setaria viridis TaxID=4556 RepID=UPI003B3BB6E6
MVANMPPSSSTAAAAAAGSCSASSITADAASGYHVLRIESYSRIKSTTPNGKYVLSHTFRAAGRTPGLSSTTPEYRRLHLLDGAAGVQLYRPGGEKKPSYVRTVKPNKFVSHGSWGHGKFVKSSDLEQSGPLEDDCSTVRCDIIVIREPRTAATTVPGASFVMVPPPDSSQHFGALLLGGKGADVRFLVADEAFAAHRCVLAARSPVFDALLFGPMKEGTATGNCIRIDGMVPQVFQSLLHFIYTDSLPEMEEQDKEASATMAQHLLEAADRYGMERLKLICEDILCRYIDVSTVATSLVLAEQHRCQGLKEACFEFLKSPKTLDEAMATDGFQHLAKSSPALFELMSKITGR